jgi:protein-tyrosine phosphatase
VRQVAGSSLWLGHVGDARNLRALLSAGIEAVVDLAANEPPVPVTRELVYCRFPLIDGVGNPPWMVRAAVYLIMELVHVGIPTMVYCSGGLSRTPAIAAAALAQIRGCSMAAALAELAASGPADVSPVLLAEVEAALA